MEFRAAKWNYDRGLTWGSQVSMKILSEEVQEFWKAWVEKDIVEMLDAFADIKFVIHGREFLFSMVKHLSTEEYYKDEKTYYSIMSYGYNNLDRARTILIDLGFSDGDLLAVYNIVCDANDKKHKERDGNGKVTKGPDWENPNLAILEYVKTLNLNLAGYKVSV